MSGADENKAWAMLAQHHYAQETVTVMTSLALFVSLYWESAAVLDMLAEAEASL